MCWGRRHGEEQPLLWSGRGTPCHSNWYTNLNHFFNSPVLCHFAGISFDLSQVTDLLESTMLSYRSDYISVYSCSWGPSDSGFTVAGPEQYARTVLQQGASQVESLLSPSLLFSMETVLS